MKRWIVFCLCICLFLSGCTLGINGDKDTVSFYYLQAKYQYYSENGVICPEQRDASGHHQDLPYLLAMYLMGPSEEELVSPLPRGTLIFGTERHGDSITIRLSDTSAVLSDMDFSLAGACLSLTCFDLTDAQSVTVTSGERSVTQTRDSVMIFDGSPASATEDTK